ncbi:MAG: dUTP diphosphatase [Eubacteriales bacterium]|nr:dUTP diphosphatase [Eubacteriales bacterium]
MKVGIKYLSDKYENELKKPSYATEGSAGLDLPACIDQPITLNPGDRQAIPTGLAIELPSPDYVAYIFARSSLGLKKGITLPNAVGVIDSDYRGQIFVALTNISNEPYTINAGERIAQLVIAPVIRAEFIEKDELEDTDRGAGGFGSTGKL